MKNLSLNVLPNQNFPCPWNHPSSNSEGGWVFCAREVISFAGEVSKQDSHEVCKCPLKRNQASLPQLVVLSLDLPT